MADNLTGVATSGSDSTAYGTVQAAYDRLVHMALRPNLFFGQLATVRPTNQTAPGNTVTLHIGNDIAAATTPLVEFTDVDAVGTSVNDVVITLAEYGNVVGSTAALEGLSYVRVDPELAKLIGYNAALTWDMLARAALDAGSNTQQANDLADASLNGATATHRLNALEVRQAQNALVRANARPFIGSMFMAIVHPDQSYDLRGETGAGAWRTPHEYADPTAIYNGEIGAFEGFRFLETTNAKVEVNAGVTTSDVYTANMVGAEALAMATAIAGPWTAMPQTVMSPQTDNLRRFRKMGWKWLGGFKEFRSEANLLLHTASSLAV